LFPHPFFQINIWIYSRLEELTSYLYIRNIRSGWHPSPQQFRHHERTQVSPVVCYQFYFETASHTNNSMLHGHALSSHPAPSI